LSIFGKKFEGRMAGIYFGEFTFAKPNFPKFSKYFFGNFSKKTLEKT